MRLVSSVLGTTSETSRDANTLALLNWGFANFRLRTPVRAGEVLARATVTDQPGLHPALVAARGLARIVDRADRVTVRVRAPRVVTGPLRRGTALGSATVLVNGRAVGPDPAAALPGRAGGVRADPRRALS